MKEEAKNVISSALTTVRQYYAEDKKLTVEINSLEKMIDSYTKKEKINETALKFMKLKVAILKQRLVMKKNELADSLLATIFDFALSILEKELTV